MKRTLWTAAQIGVVALVLALAVQSAFAFENRVTVESRTFYAGQTACTVGVYVENAVPVTGIVLPFELRAIDSGSYPASGFWRKINDSSRVGTSPVARCDPGGSWPVPCNVHPPIYVYATSITDGSCSGPVSHSWSERAANIDYVTPDAIFYAGVSMGDPALGEDIVLDPGADPLITDSAAIWIGFNVSNVVGRFEIDTCCVLPVNHLLFTDLNTQIVVPFFTKGIITIACNCPCASDPNCDGVSTDILDVFETINVAFRAKPTTVDPGCSRARTDVNCDGVTDVVDAVVVGMVSFGGLDPAVYYCAPCE